MNNITNSYLQYNNELLVKRSAIGCILAIFLMPLGSILDYFVYHNLFLEFALVRVFCSLCLVVALLFHYSNLGKAKIKYLTFIWMTIVQASLCYMIFITDDKYLSTYYAGLNLVILGIGVLLPFSATDVFIFCIITIALYIKAATAGPNIANYSTFFSNLYFVILTTVVSVTAGYFNSRNRFTEFRLNHDLKLTNQKLVEAQTQLIQSEKINALGNLSAGILHEINNPLNYAMTAVKLVKMDDKINEDADLKETVSDIEEGMTRIKNIITDLHNFAYPEKADERQNFPISSVVQSALRFTASETKGINIINNITEELMVNASKTNITQVLINLLTNAAKAINKAERTEGKITIFAKKENERIVISVADNGTGMNESTLGKVFDPFFTTSEVGKGMGMGLSVSYTIVKNHGGILKAESKLGEGSIFSFDLPT